MYLIYQAKRKGCKMKTYTWNRKTRLKEHTIPAGIPISTRYFMLLDRTEAYRRDPLACQMVQDGARNHRTGKRFHDNVSSIYLVYPEGHKPKSIRWTLDQISILASELTSLNDGEAPTWYVSDEAGIMVCM